ncbi:hypothetical protein [Nonomuraea wenchangensis]|uniref:Uncharacterized protein n=1 Tax=Nonomuraea wenchangensis TaxID=568860 RepID=A0A1I0LTY3_9ACTN|nr:hypothetical protein [Nonomuraea wenchangensis]SEU46732.1 hypothetical protein SAMN05421811_127132 [Nonomuraea wenchangensis]
MSTTSARPKRSPLVADVLYGVAGALATLAVVTYAVAAVTGRTTNPLDQADRSPRSC